MTDKAGCKVKSFMKCAGARLYGMMFKTGWPRWLFLAAAAVVFLIIASLICGGADYRSDPSALVPRSAVHFYAETRELDLVFSSIGNWSVWKEDMQKSGAEQWNQIQLALAGMLGEKVAGLGTRLPLFWLSGAKKAAFCMVEGENGGPESWAIYLEAMDANNVLSEIRIEPGFSLVRAENASEGVYELTGPGVGKLFFGVLEPWLIISSDARLPDFAAQSMKKPAFSLANSGALPDWSRKVVIRGVLNPNYMAAGSGGVSPFSVIGGWAKPEARLSFSTTLDADGLMDCRMVGVVLSDQPRGGGIFWPVMKIVLFLVGVLCAVLIVGTVSVMIGWGGWLKALALKAGISPAPAPAEVEPSTAFQEDTGAREVAVKTESAPEEVATETAEVQDSQPESVQSGSSINEDKGSGDSEEA